MQVITSFIEKRKSLLLRGVALIMPFVFLLIMVAPTVFAQTTYVITDGNRVRVYTTHATDPAVVLDQAGFMLGEDDTYTTQPGDGVSEITVQRGQTIRIDYCGQQLQVVSLGESLDELFNRMGLNTYGDYTVSEPLDTETYDGMEVTVTSVIEREVAYTVDIPYETIYCNDPNLPEGEEEIRVAGVTGQKLTTANVVYINSQEDSHTVLQESVVKQPVNQIVMVGTGTGEISEEVRKPAIGDGVIITGDGEMLTYSRSEQFKATAYTHTDEGCNMITATGTTVRIGTVAVDPSVIPYGTKMFIVSNDGKYIYGLSAAEDCGGAIKDKRLDLYFPTTAECFQFGVRECTVYFLD